MTIGHTAKAGCRRPPRCLARPANARAGREDRGGSQEARAPGAVPCPRASPGRLHRRPRPRLQASQPHVSPST
ncbi:hypothetical protein E1285_35555 [Actinomadura sp. 7K507]|nr:hypothetical protein E1285_35555 [Actinomadura sp. 7K507]